MKKLLICYFFSTVCLFSWHSSFANKDLFNAIDKLVLLKNKDFLESFEAFKSVLFKNLEDAKVQDSQGNTLLLKAIKSDNKFLARFLLETIFKPQEYINLKNSDGETPLNIALKSYLKCSLGNSEDDILLEGNWLKIIKKLLKIDSDSNCFDNFLLTIRFAIENDLIEILELLIFSGFFKEELIRKKLSSLDFNFKKSLRKVLSKHDLKLANLVESYLN